MWHGQEVLTHTIVAGEDLQDDTPGTGKLYKAVNLITKKPSVASSAGMGILLSKAGNGEMARVGIIGAFKYVAGGGAHTVGLQLRAANSGYCVAADSGDWVIGMALEAVNSGMVGVGAFNFANPAYRAV